MATTGYGKLILKTDPIRGDRSWNIHPEGSDSTYYIPKSTIAGYDPAIKTIYVEAWLLKQKGITYKLHGKK